MAVFPVETDASVTVTFMVLETLPIFIVRVAVPAFRPRTVYRYFPLLVLLYFTEATAVLEEEAVGTVPPLFVAVTVSVNDSPSSTVLLVGLRDSVGTAVSPEIERYSRLHQPLTPAEVFTFTQEEDLVSSNTVIFVPLANTRRTE